MAWIPVNKKTGIEYPPVTDAEKAAMESDPQTKGKYRFKTAPGEVPKVPKNAKEKALKPIGIEIPEEPIEYDKNQA